MKIPSQTKSEVADAINITEKLGVRVDWVGIAFWEIEKKTKHLELAKPLQTWKTQLWDLKDQVNSFEYEIVELKWTCLLMD